MGLASRVDLGAEVGRGGASLGEVAREDWLDEGAEDDLGSSSLREGHPEDEDELEGVVEWEPVDGADSAFKDCQEGINDPVSEPLSIVDLASTEKCIERVVAGDDEASNVDKELASDVKENEEEVEAGETEYSVDFGDGGRLLKVVEGGVFGQLLVELRQRLLGSLLGRHCADVLGGWVVARMQEVVMVRGV